MVISSFISSILIMALGIWAYMKLEPAMNIVAEKQLLIEPSKFSYKMWKDMPVTMYQSFTFFNLTNWNQVKSVGQKPRFVEVGPYVYRTIWTKSDINFMDEEKLVSFSEKKQWIFQPHLSRGSEDDQIWTINTPLMTALALIQNAPVITRNIVSVILDGLGEGAFIKRNIRSLLFEGYSDLIVSVGPLFDRRFSNFNGKFAYLYNKNDSIDGIWTVSTGTEDLAQLNKINRFQSSIVNMTSHSSGQPPQGLNEVKSECASAWSLDQATNGQLFTPFNQDVEQMKLQQQLAQLKARAARSDPLSGRSSEATPQILPPPSPPPTTTSKRFFSRNAGHEAPNRDHHQQDLVPNPFLTQKSALDLIHRHQQQATSPSSSALANLHQADAQQQQDRPPQFHDVGKFIFYPDLCRPIHLLPGRQEVSTSNGIKASRYYIDPRVFMNSTQVPTNKCYEMNPRPALANALAATINSVTGANVAMPNLVTGASSPFAMFSPTPNNHHHHGHYNHHHNDNPQSGLFERSNHPSSFFNSALHGFGVNNQDPQASNTNQPISRLGRVRQLFSNIVSQRMSAASPGSLLPSLAAGPASILIGNHFPSSNSRNSPDDPGATMAGGNHLGPRPVGQQESMARHVAAGNIDGLPMSSQPVPIRTSPAPVGGSDRWITQFRFKWPRGVFSIGQCQLGAPIYASLPHFLDADEYYLEQVDGLKPNRSQHEFYIDIESTLHSVPVGAKARLQLNVATPELRFRNIPNAMIPVLWQEVTFEIDKPIATMLYWSFTMSSTIYKLISILLLLGGLALLVASFVGGFKQHRRSKSSNLDGLSKRSVSRNNQLTNEQQQQQRHIQQNEGQRSSWQPHLMVVGGTHSVASVGTMNSHRNNNSSCSNSNASNETLDELRHGAALNHAFSSCAAEFRDRLGLDTHHNHNHHHHRPTTNTISRAGALTGRVCGQDHLGSSNSGGSPKQPSSRASSHCELVSAATNNTGTVNCSGCLLACLRHSPNNNLHHHQSALQDHHVQAAGCGTSDSSIVRQQASTSDLDKATLSSSRDSNLDSCSSIYATQRTTRTFK